VPKRRRNPTSELTPERKALVAGILIGEGSPGCIRRYRMTHPRIELRMCDKKAVDTVSQAFKTSTTKGTKLACPPTPENPEGRLYGTQVTGRFAHQIMSELQPHIESTELWKKWQETLKKCP